MMAPLIERNASPDICCLLFVNNFYFTGVEVAARPARRHGMTGCGGSLRSDERRIRQPKPRSARCRWSVSDC
jgi:hypothetical protein